MGRSIDVDGARPIGEALAALGDATIVMVDGALVMPNATAPPNWTEVRVKTPAGMLSLKRHGATVSIIAFGNADDKLVAMQERLAAALRR